LPPPWPPSLEDDDVTRSPPLRFALLLCPLSKPKTKKKSADVLNNLSPLLLHFYPYSTKVSHIWNYREVDKNIHFVRKIFRIHSQPSDLIDGRFAWPPKTLTSKPYTCCSSPTSYPLPSLPPPPHPLLRCSACLAPPRPPVVTSTMVQPFTDPQLARRLLTLSFVLAGSQEG
jgi:hypothetical protein